MRRVLCQLADMDPQWISPAGGWGHGVRWDCPRCMKPRHTLALLFLNPTDGSTHVPLGAKHFRVAGTSFCTLSVLEPISMPPCFRGWLRNGELLLEL